MTNDYEKREAGRIAETAMLGLDATIWKRSVATMRHAEEIYDAGELTPQRAHDLLVALLEQRKLVEGLRSAIEDGVRANARIQESIAVRAAVDAERAREGNRFVRSRVKPLPPADAAN